MLKVFSGSFLSFLLLLLLLGQHVRHFVPCNYCGQDCYDNEYLFSGLKVDWSFFFFSKISERFEIRGAPHLIKTTLLLVVLCQPLLLFFMQVSHIDVGNIDRLKQRGCNLIKFGESDSNSIISNTGMNIIAISQ